MRQGEEHELAECAPFQPTTGERLQSLGHGVQEEQPRHCREREEERTDVGPNHVAGEDSHANIERWSGSGSRFERGFLPDYVPSGPAGPHPGFTPVRFCPCRFERASRAGRRTPGPLVRMAGAAVLWMLFSGAGAAGGVAETAAQLVPPFPGDTLGVASPLSDLAVRFGARGEFGGDWTLFRPCDASIGLSCAPGLLPQLQPDIRVDLVAEGSVAGRIFVNVDFDQSREFSGSNRFQFYYRGLAGEALQRVEVGDITFALPESRFLTRGIPVGNFGALVSGEVGGVEVQTVFAQQQGARRSREFRLVGGTAEAGVIYRDTLVLDDAEYVRGQFFFLADPSEIDGAPHLDVLALRPENAPSSVGPGSAPIQLYRMERDPVVRQQVEGYIQADAVAGTGTDVVRESGWFRYLVEGEDYYLHPSGLWVALRAPLRPGDALAVTYIARSGEVVGDYNPEVLHNAGQIPTLRLLRSTQAQHQPRRATWDQEMRQFYRVSGSDDVDPFSLEVSISLGEVSGGRTFGWTRDRRPISFLRLFGIDEQSPAERVDRAAVFQPAREEFDPPGLYGTFLVFPTLRPFLEPPPVPSEGLTAEGVAGILGEDVNRRIYESLDPFDREAGGLYRLNVTAEIRSSGVTSVVTLGAFGLRPGSERIFLGDRLLQPFSDYVIEYQSGVVTLLQPELLLRRSSSNVLRVSWEEAAVFRQAPTSMVGLSARVPLSDRGQIDLVGLYQVERELVNRPRFGAEPGALGMVGARSTLDVALPAVDRFLSRILGAEHDGSPAALRFDSELAVSLPDPNRSGDAYLDDFNAVDERSVSLLTQGWHRGSAPDFRTGAEDRLPLLLDEHSAAALVWQHNWVERDPAGDSVGVFEGYFPADLDRQINVAGTQTREAGLRLTFAGGSGPATVAPQWRSVTTLLSATGADLTYTEYLDFYVAEGDSLTLIIDLGLVSEDAFFIDGQGRTSGLHPITGDPWGLGVLDQEGDPLRGEIWSPSLDALGMWVESCRAEPGRVYTPGDPDANCTRGNGRRDTEDLNGNGVLDTTERHVRYVVRLDGSSPYLARTRQGTGTAFRLFRVPLRGPHAIFPAGSFTEADWRAVQFLRVTVAGRQPSRLTLARMRLVGSRWLKRGGEGVLEGVAGDRLSLGGSLQVSPVSSVTDGQAYQPPPGVLERLDDPTSVVGGRGIELSERSLRLRYDEVGPGDRAEVYFRFLQRPRNFLSYGELRLWAVAREGSWGVGGRSDFFVKIGSDPENVYLYRVPLDPAPNSAGVRPQDWLPEHVIRFEVWTELRREAERELLENPRLPGAPPVEIWSADSTYAVILSDRARAPNLAAVREISIGIWNRDDASSSGEVWVNELRLGGGVRAPGTAQYVNVELDGGALFQGRVDYSGQGARFQQLGDQPTFQSDAEVSLSGTLQLGSTLPPGWGWDLPLAVSFRRSGRDPYFLEGTDLRALELPDVRTSGFGETRLSLAFRPEGSTGVGLVDLLLSGLDARLAAARSSGSSLTTETRASELSGIVGYEWRPAARSFPLIPPFLEPIARVFIPGVWMNSLLQTGFRWTPEEVSVRTGMHRRSLEVDRFDGILTTPVADPLGTGRAPEAWFENRARVALRPLTGFGASVEVATVRDVLDPDDGVRDRRVRDLVEAERGTLLGLGIGWETRRELVGRVSIQPRLPEWLRGDLGIQTRYRDERDPALVGFDAAGDSVPILLRNAGAERDVRASLTFFPEAFVAALGRSPNPDADPAATNWIARVARSVSPLTMSLQNGVTSRFHREAVDPGAAFQLGWGGSGSFQTLDDVQATSLVDRRSRSAATGLRLPATVFVNVNYQTTHAEALDRRTGRRTRLGIWPDIRVGVGDLPLPGSLRPVVRTVGFSAGIQRTRQATSYAGGALQRRGREDHQIPMDFSVEWVGGIITRYRGQVGWGTGTDPTGATERSLVDHGVSVETRLGPRGGFGRQVEEPLRFALALEHSTLVECRAPAGRDECVDFIDQLSRGVSLSVDTWVSGIEVGGRASLVERRTFTGIQAGFTQFQLGVWGRLVFEAGPVGRLGGRRDPF